MAKHEPIFYACDNCHVIIEEIIGTKEGFSCCGTQMEKLTPNTSEGAHEKHMPVVEQNGNTITVKVGSIFHPMSEEHSIEWIYLQTEKGGQRIQLVPDGLSFCVGYVHPDGRAFLLGGFRTGAVDQTGMGHVFVTG